MIVYFYLLLLFFLQKAHDSSRERHFLVNKVAPVLQKLLQLLQLHLVYNPHSFLQETICLRRQNNQLKEANSMVL